MNRLLAALYDPFMARTERACLEAWRSALLGDLEGEVLEIGAGTGANLPFYSQGLDRLVLAEPSAPMRQRLERSLLPGLPVEVLDAPSERLPFDDASFDAVVSTLVLCSVPDQAESLAELRRVLRPGGQLLFIEHVAASDNPGRLAWQRRLDPLWSRLAGGCHLDRDTGAAIEAAGFVLEEVRRESMRQALPLVRATIRGRASLRLPAPRNSTSC